MQYNHQGTYQTLNVTTANSQTVNKFWESTAFSIATVVNTTFQSWFYWSKHELQTSQDSGVSWSIHTVCYKVHTRQPRINSLFVKRVRELTLWWHCCPWPVTLGGHQERRAPVALVPNLLPTHLSPEMYVCLSTSTDNPPIYKKFSLCTHFIFSQNNTCKEENVDWQGRGSSTGYSVHYQGSTRFLNPRSFLLQLSWFYKC